MTSSTTREQLWGEGTALDEAYKNSWQAATQAADERYRPIVEAVKDAQIELMKEREYRGEDLSLCVAQANFRLMEALSALVNVPETSEEKE